MSAPHSLESTSAGAPSHHGGSAAVACWAPLAWMKQVVCSMHGHDYLLRVTNSRLFLHCPSCGHETPGWSLQ